MVRSYSTQTISTHIPIWGTTTVCWAVLAFCTSGAAQSNPVLNSLFPPGGRAGTSVDVTVTGSGLDELKSLHCGGGALTFKKTGTNRVRINIPPETPAGFYDLRALCAHGLSSPRAFMIGKCEELLEVEPNGSPETATRLTLNTVANGCIEKKGDIDQFQFVARPGEHIVIECRANRIDSGLRAVLELRDSSGRRLAVNRGYFGIDPLIQFRVPAEDTYILKVFDLIHAGGSDYFYRLSVGKQPRIVFSHPTVVQAGTTTRVTLYGWNLKTQIPTRPVAFTESPKVRLRKQAPASVATKTNGDSFQRLEVDVTAPANGQLKQVRLPSIQAGVDGFAFHYPGSAIPIRIGLTDVPVVRDYSGNHLPDSAQQVSIPCEVSGQLVDGDERDWYAIDASRGEVLWIEGFAARIGAPVDLDISVLDSSGEHELARFSDEVRNIGGKPFPTAHLDPADRWVVPVGGRYLVLVRNLIGNLSRDARRVYRLSIRREEPEFHVAVIDRRDTPAALNVQRGGRTILDVLAFRRRGMTGTIRVSAKNLPVGIECPDVYLGPGINRVPLILSAADSTRSLIHNLELVGHATSVHARERSKNLDVRPPDQNTTSTSTRHSQPRGRAVRAGAVVRAGLPNGSARLTADLPFVVTGEAPLRITADGNEPRSHHLYGELNVRHSPGSILDVAVEIERRDSAIQAPVRLIGVGLPALIHNQTATIPAGRSKGYLSFYLPPTLPVGRYSIAVKADTTIPADTQKGTSQTTTVFSNPVTFDVQPAAFVVEIDPYAPKKIGRGKVVQIQYSARRINGFIGKIYTKLAAADQLVGLRGRGVTFVGQTDRGTIQIIANGDAPLGQQPFVRFYGVGVVEDQPVYHGSCFLNLEIIE